MFLARPAPLAAIAVGIGALSIAATSVQAKLSLGACLGKDFAAYDKVLGKPVGVASSQAPIVVSGKHYSEDEMAALPKGTARSASYNCKVGRISLDKDAGKSLPNRVFVVFSKAKPKTWSQALGLLGISTSGVKATKDGDSFDLSGIKATGGNWSGYFSPKDIEAKSLPTLYLNAPEAKPVANNSTTQKSVEVLVYSTIGDAKTELQNGTIVRGEVNLRVTARASDPISSVEFYVGDDLRDTDNSTPYEFKIDGLAEDDGELKLRFKAYSSEGYSGEKLVIVKVDNGIAKGAAFHVEKGNEFLSEGKFGEALFEGRIALKADEKYLPAKLLMARVNLQLGVLDKAQTFAEDVLAAEPKNVDALLLLSTVNVQKAFVAANRGASNRDESFKSITTALSAAIENRLKVLDLEVERVGNPTDENLILFADTAIRAKRYSRVTNALRSIVSADPKRTDLVNRYVFALLREGRAVDAIAFLETVKKFGKYDAYTHALEAVAHIERGDDTASDAAIKEGILDSPESLGVRTAQAYIALKRSRKGALDQLARSLAKDADTRPETYYFLSALANQTNQYQAGRRAFERAVRVEPADVDLYIEQGNEAILLSQAQGIPKADAEFQLSAARAFFELALQVQPSSSPALTGLTIANLYLKKYDDALKLGDQATKAGPTYAAAWYAYAAAISAKAGDPREVFSKAVQLDPKNLAGRTVPNGEVAWRYFNSTGRVPLISPPNRG